MSRNVFEACGSLLIFWFSCLALSFFLAIDSMAFSVICMLDDFDSNQFIINIGVFIVYRVMAVVMATLSFLPSSRAATITSLVWQSNVVYKVQ